MKSGNKLKQNKILKPRGYDLDKPVNPVNYYVSRTDGHGNLVVSESTTGLPKNIPTYKELRKQVLIERD